MSLKGGYNDPTMHSLPFVLGTAYVAVALAWLPEFLRWPFAPGVFIAILGFLAAVVTFWEKPPKPVKAFCVVLFFGLMWGEIWMVGKDRLAHEKSEKEARDFAQQQLSNASLLINGLTAANGLIAGLKRDLVNAKGNPQLVASLQAQIATAQENANNTSTELVIAMVPGISQQLFDIAQAWQLDDDKASLPQPLGSQAERQQRMSAVTARYEYSGKPLMVTANYLRQQLLQRLPLSDQNEEDTRQAAVFTKVVAGEPIGMSELFRASQYLKDLSKRIAASKAKSS